MPDLDDLMREGLSLSEAIRVSNAIADFTPEEMSTAWREVVEWYKQEMAKSASASQATS